MKFYIPTTSLNFNNIFSTESISPAAFYKMREFGYSRWNVIPENNQEGVVLLYEKPFHFERGLSDLEDYPMLIEIDTNEKFKEIKNGVYISEKTIYLHFSTTRVIFFSEEDKRKTLSMSTCSLETKFVNFYKERFVIETFTTTCPDVSRIHHLEIKEDEITYDRRINKLKGLLYGYYIGAMLSSTSSNVKRSNILYEIQNLLSAIHSSPDRSPTFSQKEKLIQCCQLLQNDEPIIKELREFLTTEHVHRVLKVCLSHGLRLSQYSVIDILSNVRCDEKNGNQALNWIKQELESHKHITSNQRRKLSVEQQEIYIGEGQQCSISPDVFSNQTDNRLLCQEWVNDVFLRNKFNGNISSFREELSDEITLKAKDFFGDRWEMIDGKENKTREFLNALRRAVRREDLGRSYSNGLMSSIASVLLKGDDWEKLLAFMQQNEMTDYKLAFAFYGELNGFANLSRDFTDILLLSEQTYVENVYNEFVYQLHKIKLSPLNDAKKPLKAEPEKPSVKTLKEKILDWVKHYVLPKNFKGTPKEVEQELQDVFTQMSTTDSADKLLKLLKKEKHWNKKKILKDLTKYLGELNLINTSPVQGELFSTSSTARKNGKLPLLVKDTNLLQDIRTEFRSMGLDWVEQLTGKVLAFVNRYKNDGYYGKNPQQYRQENSHLIDHLLRCLKNSNKKTPDLEFPLENEEKKFQMFLEKRYNCKRNTHQW